MATTSAGQAVLHRINENADALQALVPWQEEHRRLHDDAIRILSEAGVFAMRVPKMFGGSQCNAADMVAVATALGRIDGSLGWTAQVSWIPTWMAGMLPEVGAKEVLGSGSVIVSGTLAPGGVAKPTDGGYMLSGNWKFTTGSTHANWQQVVVIKEDEGLPLVCLVPQDQVSLQDDWDTVGVRGSGSFSTSLDNVFVPEHRSISMESVVTGAPADPDMAQLDMYQTPLLPVAGASSVGALLGLGEAAWDSFTDRITRRGITYSDYEIQADAALTHHQLAQSRLELDEAGFHSSRIVNLLDESPASDRHEISLRVRSRAGVGRVCQLVQSAVDRIATASGASSAYLNDPIQRIRKDVHVLNLHALMVPDTAYELYGRFLAGKAPNTQYL